MRHTLILVRDTLLLFYSIVLAVAMVQCGLLSSLLNATQGVSFISSFVSGFFFTSVFTTAPAIAALGETSLTHAPIFVALFGAAGAVCGDYVLFSIVRDSASKHLMHLQHLRGTGRKLTHLLKRRAFRWFVYLLAGMIIASPLPDEIGLSLLGFAHVKTLRFLPLSFVCNFAGIYLLALGVRALA